MSYSLLFYFDMLCFICHVPPPSPTSMLLAQFLAYLAVWFITVLLILCPLCFLILFPIFIHCFLGIACIGFLPIVIFCYIILANICQVLAFWYYSVEQMPLSNILLGFERCHFFKKFKFCSIRLILSLQFINQVYD